MPGEKLETKPDQKLEANTLNSIEGSALAAVKKSILLIQIRNGVKKLKKKEMISYKKWDK